MSSASAFKLSTRFPPEQTSLFVGAESKREKNGKLIPCCTSLPLQFPFLVVGVFSSFSLVSVCLSLLSLVFFGSAGYKRIEKSKSGKNRRDFRSLSSRPAGRPVSQVQPANQSAGEKAGVDGKKYINPILRSSELRKFSLRWFLCEQIQNGLRYTRKKGTRIPCLVVC